MKNAISMLACVAVMGIGSRSAPLPSGGNEDSRRLNDVNLTDPIDFVPRDADPEAQNYLHGVCELKQNPNNNVASGRIELY